MKTEKDILDSFGRILIAEVYDNQLKFIKNSLEDLSQTDGYRNLFSGMSQVQKQELENYTSEILKGSLFGFLRIFEENEEYKIIHVDETKVTDLVQVSEMLKAEPIAENGWIQKYSVYSEE